MSDEPEGQERRAEDKILRLMAFHAKLLTQVRSQHDALVAMHRQLEEVLATVRTAREKWPGKT